MYVTLALCLWHMVLRAPVLVQAGRVAPIKDEPLRHSVRLTRASARSMAAGFFSAKGACGALGKVCCTA